MILFIGIILLLVGMIIGIAFGSPSRNSINNADKLGAGLMILGNLTVIASFVSFVTCGH